MTSGPITSWQIYGEQWLTLFSGAPKSLQMVIVTMKLRCLLLGGKAMTNLDRILKSRDITLSTKVCLAKAMIFAVVIYGCESWTIKENSAPENWCFWTVVLEKTIESPLDYRRSNQSILKEIGNRKHWIFIGTTDAEVDTPILWPPDVKNWVIGKDPDAGKDWRQEEKGTTEDDMVGWHHRFKGYAFEQAPRVGNGQGSLVYWSPWGHKESHMTEWLNRSELPSKGFPWWLR